MKVILEGSNSDWAAKHYLPLLVGKAAKDGIDLWAIDVVPQIKLDDSNIADLWQIAQSRNNAHYLDKSDPRDSQYYEGLSDADYVFVVTPDEHHCETAEFWLDRLTTQGKIFIEKPLDGSLRAALMLKSKIENKKEAVFGFDHYLARALPFLQKLDEYLEEIGEIKRIKCHILEPFGIPSNRVEALDKGMIFDLFCHIIALAGAVVMRSSTPSEEILQKVQLVEVKAAQYVGSPISGETFAWIRFYVSNNIEAESAVGKCVGTSEEKIMKIHGSKGHVKLDLLSDKFFVFDSQGNREKHGRLNPTHVERFLNEVLQGREPLSAPGVLTFDAAFEILKILGEARMCIGKMPKYQVTEHIGEILRRF